SLRSARLADAGVLPGQCPTMESDAPHAHSGIPHAASVVHTVPMTSPRSIPTALVDVIKQLACCRELDGVMAVLREATRRLTAADGVTVVLRDGDFCYYAEENAIAPLWKGRRFPMQSCVSGWCMLNRQPVAIEDIYADE